MVSEGDFTHICDPFHTCNGTYCCECSDFGPLDEFAWADTGERISDYRARLEKATPGLVKAWRFGLGLLLGGVFGAMVGYIAAVVTRQPDLTVYPAVGGIIGALFGHGIGGPILNAMYGIDYRRMR